MSDFNIVNNNDFMIEKIKERPINRRKLMKRTIITATMAVIFGLVACFTILLLEPVISNWLYPEEEASLTVTFPEEKEEMEPEEMLADNLPDNTANTQAAEANTVQPELSVSQIKSILNSLKLDMSNYVQIYDELDIYTLELEKSMVTVTGVRENYDWLENSYESTNNVPGLIIAENEEIYCVLTFSSAIAKADKVEVTFANEKTAEASFLQKHAATDLALLSVDKEAVGTERERTRITIADLGSSKSSALTGSPVVALGSPMGVVDSVAYGMITAFSQDTSAEDFVYDTLLTDIYGNASSQGFLFNMDGQVIGIFTKKSASEDMENIITAYGISDLKLLITMLSSGNQIPRLGIRGISVTKDANERLYIPFGAYVTDVVINSPAMRTGLQAGDIIISANETLIDDYGDLERVLYNAEVGQILKLKIMRQSQDIYKEMSMDVTLTGVD